MCSIFYNGKIYIERGVFADAVLVKDGIISKCGSLADVEKYRDKDCQKIDLRGKTMIPGFNDSHQHTLNSGVVLSNVMLAGTKSIDEMIARGKNFIENNNIAPGAVVVGNGWNQDYFTDEVRMPNRFDLDKISTDYPIIFSRACGHISVANSAALKMAGITKDSKDVPGGMIYRDENGEPNGLVSENAQGVLKSIIPHVSAEYVADKLKLAMKHAASLGITSVQTNDIRQDDSDVVMAGYNLLYKTFPQAIRVYHQSYFTSPDDYLKFITTGHATGEGDDMQKFGPLKMFVDGSLGARTAWMKKPYHDDKSTSGIPTMTPRQLDKMVSIAQEHNCQVAIHAIGDAAIQMVLDAYSKVIPGRDNKNRHAVIHVQVTDKNILQQFYDKNILAQVQPIFIHYDMNVIYDRVGDELAQTSYNFGTLYRMGVHTSYGTDSPVEDMQPFENMYCAVTRKRLDGKKTYLPSEAVDIYDAIDQYTIGSAYCSFDEDKKGRIRPGYFADFAVLDRDIFTVEPEEIKNVKCVMTVLGGKIIYEA
jgi:predicted amidohydrolase YtcJ